MIFIFSLFYYTLYIIMVDKKYILLSNNVYDFTDKNSSNVDISIFHNQRSYKPPFTIKDENTFKILIDDYNEDKYDDYS